MQIVMLLMNRLLYFFCFKPISLIFKISCLIFLARTSYSMSTGNGKNEQPWLISNLRGKTFTVSSLNPWLQTFSYRRVCVCQLLSCVQLFATPWAIDCQGPLSTEFSRQEYWSGLPFPSPGDLLSLGIEPGSPALQEDFRLLNVLFIGFRKLSLISNFIINRYDFSDIFVPTQP